MAGSVDRLLLDTHALIWWWLADSSLSGVARRALSSRGSDILVSAVTGFEIAQKVRRGRLPVMAEPLARYGEYVMAEGFAHLAISVEHAVHAGLLPGEHRDPFDRLLAAQALIEDATVVTRDAAFAAFGCKVLW